MAKIISMSLNNRILKNLDKLQEEMGFSGRSEAVRAGIRALLTNQKELLRLKGIVDAALLVVHDDKYSDEVSQIKHNHSKIIKTQIHNHLENHKCLEIFVLKGVANDIKQIYESFQANKKIDTIKFVVL